MEKYNIFFAQGFFPSEKRRVHEKINYEISRKRFPPPPHLMHESSKGGRKEEKKCQISRKLKEKEPYITPIPVPLL